MTGSKSGVLLLVVSLIMLAGCATGGRMSMDEEVFRFNRSAIEQEEEDYRLWVWRSRGWPFRYFGESPIGLQLLVPGVVEPGTTLVIGEDCELWMRRDWSLVGAAANTLWAQVQAGSVSIDVWDPDAVKVSGRVEAKTTNGPLEGTFVVNRRTLSDNVIR